ncbi:helix-turn-helix transcriptional regulator [Rhodopseudomonas palustris]|uniref:Transcriptional regulator, LuxR family n=1 Tax=Rhodopseudomonas palustris (strain BisB18) TaxID=316056 RepID=Q21BG2_RHOPB
MPGSEFRHFDRALAAIERFQTTTSPRALIDAVRDAAAAYGYRSFVIAAAPKLACNAFDKRVLLRHWPEAWFGQYLQDNYQDHDPIAAHARQQTRAFCWSDAPWDRSDKKTAAVMDCAAHDYDMRRGFCVPIFGMRGYEAAISFGGPEIDASPAATAAMELIAIYAMNQLMTMREPPARRQTTLSPREREVVAWAAVGKTAWDTARILAISTDTVNKHMASAMRKLDACTKTQAVVESIRRGEIEL